MGIGSVARKLKSIGGLEAKIRGEWPAHQDRQLVEKREQLLQFLPERKPLFGEESHADIRNSGIIEDALIHGNLL